MTNNNLSTSGRVSPLEKDYLFSTLLADDQLLRGTMAVLCVTSLDARVEPHLIVLWRAVTDLITERAWPEDKHQRRLALECRCDFIVSQAGPAYAPFIGMTMNVIEQSWNGQAVMDRVRVVPLLRKFLKERLCYDRMRSIMGAVPAQQMAETMAPLFEDVKTLETYIDRLGEDRAYSDSSVFAQGWDLAMSLDQLPSGMTFVDRVTCGGMARKEIGVILATTGGSKTTYGITAAVCGARYQHTRRLCGQDFGYWYYFCYEEPIEPFLRRRVICNAAQISWSNTLATMKSSADLSLPGNLKEYETRRWAKEIQSGIPVLSESERIVEAMEYVGDTLRLVDFSGDKDPLKGSGGPEEIRDYLLAEIDSGRQPVGIVIDYAGLAVKRVVAQRRMDPKAEYNLLDSYVNEIRVQIASRFNSVVWVLHQLHGESGSKPSTHRQHHSGARGARNFGDNANFIFSLGTLDKSSNCLVYALTKGRRVPPPENDPVVLLDGDFNMVTDASDRYVVDKQSGRIVDRRSAAMFGNTVDPAVANRMSARATVGVPTMPSLFGPPTIGRSNDHGLPDPQPPRGPIETPSDFGSICDTSMADVGHLPDGLAPGELPNVSGNPLE